MATLLESIKKPYHPLYFIAILLLGIGTGYSVHRWRVLGDQGQALMAGTAITILIISMFRDRFFETRAIRTLDEIKTYSEHEIQELRQWIISNLEPTIISLNSNESVLTD